MNNFYQKKICFPMFLFRARKPFLEIPQQTSQVSLARTRLQVMLTACLLPLYSFLHYFVQWKAEAMDSYQQAPMPSDAGRVWSQWGRGRCGVPTGDPGAESKVCVLINNLGSFLLGQHHSCLMVLSKEFSLWFLNGFPSLPFLA